jgi:uncharacterized RDD family membrane protein YckC
MKRVIGIIILLLSFLLIGILGLRIWDIEVVSLDIIFKSTATLILLGIAIVVLIIVYGALLRGKSSVYNKQSGNSAHPKQ